MPKFQVVEKDDYGTDWHQVRFDVYAMKRFDSEEEAIVAAKEYLTHVNCNNPLTKEEKKAGLEAYMMIKNAETDADECFLGTLDREDWFMTDRKGSIVSDKAYFELEGKAEVAVHPVRGT